MDGVGEWLKALAAFPDDTGSILSTHTEAQSGL